MLSVKTAPQTDGQTEDHIEVIPAQAGVAKMHVFANFGALILEETSIFLSRVYTMILLSQPHEHSNENSKQVL